MVSGPTMSVRTITALSPGEPMFGTILRPTSGIRLQAGRRWVRHPAGNALFALAPKGENHNRGAGFCPLAWP